MNFKTPIGGVGGGVGVGGGGGAGSQVGRSRRELLKEYQVSAMRKHNEGRNEGRKGVPSEAARPANEEQMPSPEPMNNPKP